MVNLKRRWQNFSTASRLLVVSAFLSVIAITGLVIYLQLQTAPGTSPVQSDVSKTSPTPLPTPVSFNYAAQPDATPAPAPKDEPARLLVLANRFLADGEPIDAAAQYRLIISNYPQSKEVIDASFGLAQSSAARGRWQEATDLYKTFLNTYPNDAHRRLVMYALGDIQKAQGYWDDAISYYQKYLQEKDGKMLEGYAWFDIGEAYDNIQKKDQAIEAYKKAGTSVNASNLVRVTALERVGDYYVAQGDASAAAGWYNKILDIATLTDYKASIMLKMAKAYASQKQTGQANTIYNIIADQYLQTPSGLAAVKALDAENPTTTSDFHQAYMAFQAGNWPTAITEFSKVLGRTDENAAPNTSPAFPASLSKADQTKMAQTWYWLARAYEFKGDTSRAANEYRELQIRLPQTDVAQDALWRIAVILRNANQTDAALAQYAYIAQAYPFGRYMEQALYNQASLTLTRNGPEAAQPLANNFADKYPASELRNEVLFELYRAFDAKGNKLAASSALQKLATSTSADYYAFRAAEIISGQDPLNLTRSNPLTHPAVYDPVRFAQDAEKDRKDMETWLLTWVTPVASTTTPGASTTPNNAGTIAQQNFKSDAGLKRLAELRLLGHTSQAEREAKEAIDRYSDKPFELYLTALYLNEQSDYYNSLDAAHDLLALYRAKKIAAGARATPLMLQKLLYPLDYQNLVLEYSKRNNFDPLLFLALVKQESAFKSNAVSSVGARGLTQVMPDTGRAIATNLDKPGFNVDDLFRPATSIEFGAFYLGKRLEDYQGNPFPALAAYNGGVGNVNRWLAANPIDRGFDNFVENIDYPETRNYVRTIYTNYAMYRQIYGVAAS